MWRKQKNSNYKIACIETLIAAGVVVEGDIHYRGGIQIDGTVKGNIIADPDCGESVVRVTRTACVSGDLEGPNILINGKVEGNVVCSQHLELASDAVVCGNVHYQLIEMVAGAEVNGNLFHIIEEPLKDQPEKIAEDSVAEMIDGLKLQLNGDDRRKKA